MTDRELMQQALEALEKVLTGLSILDDGPDASDVNHAQNLMADGLAIAARRPALRERLAQPEHHDPIGDAQDKLIAEQAATRDYRTRYDRGCYKCGSHYCPADCPMPTHLAPQQLQMQPCAGRNCGSTNPNLHSAECFEDYEKTTGMNQWIGLTDEEVVDLKMFGRDLEFASMTALRRFARDIEATLKERNHD